MFGNSKDITKEIKIEGMSCSHCAGKVENSLKAIKGVKEANVDLESKKATVRMRTDVENEMLKNAVEELGYSVTDIS